jgi:hypothetical protein
LHGLDHTIVDVQRAAIVHTAIVVDRQHLAEQDQLVHLATILR